MEVRTALSGLALVAALAVPAAALADDCAGEAGGGAAKLVVVTEGVRASAGNLNVTVYPDDRRRFLAKGGKLLRLRVDAVKPATSACFWVPPDASYAVVVYHDADNDRKFDRVLTGPKEGYGFSNDAPARFGLPSFESVRFRFKRGDKPVRIHLRYPN